MKVKVGYIMSSAYSGSTLLAMMLGAHSQIATTGEAHGGSDWWLFNADRAREYICSCGTPVVDCAWWQALSKRMAVDGEEKAFPDLGVRYYWTRNQMMYRVMNASLRSDVAERIRHAALRIFPPTANMLNRVHEQNVRMMQAALAIENASVFVDSSKAPIRCENLNSANGLEVRPILLVRDGRAVGWSNVKRNKQSFENAVLSWTRFVATAIRVTQRMNIPFEIVKYEDLCASPAVTLNRLFGFLGVEPQEWSDDIALPAYHVLGNDSRMRFSTKLKQPDTWEDKLSQSQRDYFQKTAGSVATWLGYDL
ncbi:sulfotransferase family protein [Oleiphilus messinensis]|uniref:hypothetical protein n=1 Tax=Oleiphilus messinensis TaxID=141451 RepID=UPI000B3B25DB|nr:hypothetical protein [Oleiphilus messinensis]